MFSFPTSGKKVLFATLNWGLGHSSRSIPLINSLIEQGKSVTIASDGDALKLLQMEFPQLPSISLPRYNVRYKKTLFKTVISNLLNICSAIISEHYFLKRYLKKNDCNLIVSDSRFGFFNSTVYSVIISHQLRLQCSNTLLKVFINLINGFFLNRFNECWVPDDQYNSLSGVLSKNNRIEKIKFIGPLSRMKSFSQEINYDVSIVLSGPEPSRTMLEEKLLAILSMTNLSVVLVRGTQCTKDITIPDNWRVYNLIDTLHLNKILLSSKTIISRSGYSSIMDYVELKRSAILIPTPGQSEQEYLADYLHGKHRFMSLPESELKHKLLPLIKQFL